MYICRANRYGRVRLESIPELSMEEARYDQQLESFTVAELKEGGVVGEQQEVEETVVYFNSESGLALVEGGETVTIQAVMGEGGQVLSLVPMEHTV
jgi:hypothetical protein